MASRRASEPSARPLAPMSFGLCGSHDIRGSDTSKGNCADRWSFQFGRSALRRSFQAEIVGLLDGQRREDRQVLPEGGVNIRGCARASLHVAEVDRRYQAQRSAYQAMAGGCGRGSSSPRRLRRRKGIENRIMTAKSWFGGYPRRGSCQRKAPWVMEAMSSSRRAWWK